jgi:thiol-disulfide isomerase/thioredoxin
MNWLKILIVVAGVVLLVQLGKYLYFKPKYHKFEKAPDFRVELIDGSQFQLNQLNGSYVLLDFWGSWCGPCRAENPGLVGLYKKYNGHDFDGAESFEIVSIGLENSEKAWRTAIAKDGLDWEYHHAEFNRMRSKVGSIYGVREIPTKYLIGPDRKIILVNPTINEIDRFLKEKISGTKG